MGLRHATIIALLLGAWLPASAQVLSPTVERIGDGKLRVYAGDMFVRPDGKEWREIPDVVSIEQDGSAWVVSYRKEWIRLTPSAPFVIKRAILEAKRFGPILDRATAPDEILYNVTYSAGVIATADGWQFKDVPDDVWLGVCIHDWQRLLGEKLTLAADSATLDLRDVKLTSGDEINLDPTVTAGAQSGYLQSSAMSDWEICRTNVSTVVANNNINASAHAAPGLSINRGYMEFDTSSLGGTPTSVTWNAKTSALYGGSNTVQLTRLVSPYGTLELSDWDASEAEVESTYTFAGTGTWNSISVNPAGINESGSTSYTAREYFHDVLDSAPTPVESHGGYYYGPNSAGNEPYLEVLVEAPGPKRSVDFEKNWGKASGWQ